VFDTYGNALDTAAAKRTKETHNRLHHLPV